MYRRICRRLSLLTLNLLLLLPATALAQPPLVDSLRLIQEVESVYWDSMEPPPPGAPWQADVLPYNTFEDASRDDPLQGNSRYVWFRFPVDNTAQAETLGLYFWRFNLAIAVYFNGHELASSLQQPGRETMSWNHPMLVAIQEPAWQSDTNEVMVRLSRSAWGGTFAPVVFGDMEALTPLMNARMLRQVELNEIFLALGIGLTLASLSLWLVRRRDTVYLWFSGMSLSWSAMTSHMVILLNPIPYSVWLPLVHVAIDTSIFCMYGFIGRLIQNVKRPGRERLFLVWTVLASITHFFTSPEYFFLVAYSIHLVGFIALSIIVFRVAKLAIREHNASAIVVSLALFVQIALFAHNYFLMFFGSTAQWEGNMFYAHFGIPLLFLVFIGTLLWRFHNALTVAEEANRDLEAKIEESRKLIESSYAERRVLELRQAAEQERLNIYRELHDDVGSKLLSIVHAEQSNKLSNMARSALESLRQAVSRANHPDQLLHTFLSDIREETELRLQGSGHEVIWTQRIPGDERILPSRIAFNLNRILKEVVSNIIRHASANQVHIDVTIDEKHCAFAVTDNGRGFDREGAMGNGIHNIQSRAQEIEAQAQWLSQFGHGTRFSITLVCQLAHPEAAAPAPEQPSG
ncbi:MAG: ATP-binding protein [Pseudomonadales bacterium]|nr:ATP-binding protein [Pseudomonadales bacterium]MCP5330438.1 ATP-binding protein [Pseudomonadales bacterium]MCP5343949.1 ATP-binding protein [Pseudomonadales bacterium]